MEEAAREAKLQIHKQAQGNITLLKFVGTIDENFDGPGVARGLEGQLIISLEKVRRITSFGIRQWVDFIMAASQTASAIYFIECAPRIVDQFNMVANFGGRGMILSFYAPFRCDQCGAERMKLIQVDRDREMIRGMNLEGDLCPNDNSQEYFDDDPDTYLSYVGAQADFDVDPQVAAFLQGRTQYNLPDGVRKTRVEKKVHGRYTFLSISGDVGEDFPMRKIAEGLEGDVVFDLAGVGQVTPEGRDRWRQLLAGVAPTTERIILVGLPLSMLDGFSRKEDLAEKGQVITVHLPHMCNSCSVTSLLEVDVGKHYDVLRFATPPELTCPDCGKPVTCVAGEGVLTRLTELPQPAPDLNTDEIIKWARKPPETPAGATARPVAVPAAAPFVGGPARAWPLLAALVVVILAGAGVGLYVVVSKTKEAGMGPGMEAVLVEASHPKVPNWKDGTFTVQGNQVLVAGHSGLVEDKEQGFNLAQAAALEELAHQVATSIRDPVWVEHVGSQFQSFRSKAMGDLEQALVAGDHDAIAKGRRRVLDAQKAVAQGLMEGAGGTVRPERSQYYWEKLKTAEGVRYRVWSLYRVAKTEFKWLVEQFSKREEALSAFAVTLFPGMGWRYNQPHGAVIVGMNPDSPLKYVGVLPGDILLSAQDRVIKDAASFRRVLDQEYTDLQREGGAMVLAIKRGDGPVVKHRLRVAKKKATPVAGKRPHRPVGSGTGGKRPPAANIWEDSPFE
jgi:hypothetical protein